MPSFQLQFGLSTTPYVAVNLFAFAALLYLIGLTDAEAASAAIRPRRPGA